MSFHKKYETCLIIIHATSRCHFFLLTQIFSLNVCNFNSFDLDDDQKISETELSTLIDITGAEDLDEFFEKLDVNKGKIDILKYTNETFIDCNSKWSLENDNSIQLLLYSYFNLQMMPSLFKNTKVHS